MRKQFEAQFIQFDHRFHGLVARCIVLVEHHFFLLHVRPFFLDFCAQSIQQCRVIVALNGLTFLKIVDKQNTMRVPKYGCHNLASLLLSFWSLWTAFTSCCSLSWWSVCVRFVMVDPCFIHCHIPTQKILFTSLEQLQTAFWTHDALSFLVGYE